MAVQIEYDPEAIEAFCHKWLVKELSLFGSVVTGDFGPESDVDVLVTFSSEARWSLMDWAAMIDDLRTIFGRDVDLVEKPAIRNPFRRRVILESSEVIHAA
jgi:hypothetical protein